MPTTLTNGIQLPDKGSVDWYSSMQSNYNLIDTHLGNTDTHVTAEDKANWDSKQGSLSQAQLDAIAQVATNTSDITALQSGKADASHTHSSSDITDIDDYATKDYVDNSISGLVDNAPAALDTLKELSTALNDDANFATTITNALSAKANSADLATVATSGSYNDLSNKPTINDSTITIQKNGSLVGTFTVNGSAKTIDIPVPTKTSDLTNDSNFVDTSNSAVASGITSAKVTAYDSHVADTDIHVTTADKTKWNTVTSKANDANVMHLSGDETASGQKTLVNLLPLKGEYLGTEASNNARTLLYFIANRDTQNQSGIFLTKFRQNKPQGSMTGNDVAYLSFDCLENSVRTNNGLRINFLNFVDDIPQQFILWSGITEKLLGAASAPWSDVYTNKINSLNPGALSFPDLNNGLDISGYITDLTGASNINKFTPTVNGWVSIGLSNADFIEIYIPSNLIGGTFTKSIINNYAQAFMPVIANKEVRFALKGASIAWAKFYPCLGNV